MLIGPKFVAIAYWHQLGVIHRCLWDTLGHSGTFWDTLGHSGTTLGVWDCLWDHLEYFHLEYIFPGTSSEVLHTGLRNFLHLQLRNFFLDRPQKCYTLNLEKFYTYILRSVTKDIENFLNL